MCDFVDQIWPCTRWNFWKRKTCASLDEIVYSNTVSLTYSNRLFHC
jgi:hypothetical protein